MTIFGSDLWDERYGKEDFLYGQNPNQFFKSQLSRLKPGKLFLPGDGEGRNSVYAASLGWQVDAVDFSKKAIEKSKEFSRSFNVSINYEIADLITYTPKPDYYDCASIIFVHLESKYRKKIHKKIADSLKKAGIVIIEVYEKKQLGKNSGGPQNEDMLYSINEIQNDFKNFNIIYLHDEIIELKESEKHLGPANVIRFVGQKK